MQQFKEAGDLKKGAKQNIKKVGSTINKKANTKGKQVICVIWLNCTLSLKFVCILLLDPHARQAQQAQLGA